MIHGIHRRSSSWADLTVLSAIVFRELKNDDGDTVSQPMSFSMSGDEMKP